MALKATIEDLFSRLVLSVVAPAATIVLALYILNSLGDIKYLPASGMAFGIGFFMIYLVFKYWIKPDSTQQSFQQLVRYLIVFVINLVINIEIVYLLVDHVGVSLLAAQTIAAVVIAYESYYAYLSLLYRSRKRVVVRRPKKLEDEIIYYDSKGEKM